jgi:hypothetical protein
MVRFLSRLFPGSGSPLSCALNRAALGARLAVELEGVDRRCITTETEAKALCRLASRFPVGDATQSDTEAGFRRSDLHHLVGLFQDVEDEDCIEILRSAGIPELIRVFERRAELPACERHALLFLLEILALYGEEPGLRIVADALAEGFECDNYLWSVILSVLGPDHPDAPTFFALTRMPPASFARVAYLDLANALAREGLLPRHPFDGSEGQRILLAYLESTSEDEAGYAQSAAASLPFICAARRQELMAVARAHPAETVRTEAAWAAARLAESWGVEYLVARATQPQTAGVALRHLEEVGAGSAIPEAARDPDFLALAEMSDWLSHPNEYGRPPDRLSLALRRELFWPPTNDRRTLWVVRYEYDASRDSPDTDAGYGLVGSTTFALFGESTAELDPDDVLALHCCWELEVNGDPRAPAHRSSQAGRRILEENGSS